MFVTGWLNGMSTNRVGGPLTETSEIFRCFNMNSAQNELDIRWFVHNAVTLFNSGDYDGFNSEMACAQPLIQEGLEDCSINSYYKDAEDWLAAVSDATRAANYGTYSSIIND